MKETTLKIANTNIVLGNKYNVVGKPDKDAPKAFQEHETTKYLFEGLQEHRTVPYDEETNSWDTAFEYDSPSNKNTNKVEVDNFKKHIKEPYEKRFKVSLDSTNDDFWQDYSLALYTNKEFNTNKPKDLLDLFQALKKGYVCEKGEKAYDLQGARYCIEDNNKKKDLKERRANAKMDAYFTLNTLLATIKKDDDLYTILEWISFPSARTLKDVDALKTAVALFFDNPISGQVNCEKFLETYEALKKPEMKAEMEYYSALTKLSHQGKLKYSKRQYHLNGILVGNSLKEGAKVASFNDERGKELQKTIQDALEKS